MFATNNPADRATQALGQLVKDPFKTWRRATRTFNKHQITNYHKYSVLRADDLQTVVDGKRQSVIDLIDTCRVKQAKENRLKLTPIIKTLLFCGRNGFPLDKSTIRQEGNFRQLIRFRLDSGDQALKEHLVTSSKNANYLSWKIQNEIINACNQIILKRIVERANQSECFSVLADETTDMSTQEQSSICIRFIDKDKKMNESLLQFVPVVSTSSESLANTLVQFLSSIGLNLSYLKGQGYNGAAAMSGRFNGVHAKIMDL